MTKKYKTTLRVNVPQGRNGKHKEVVTRILKELDELKDGSALEIPLEDLPYSKEKIRSALNRATHKSGRKIATAADATRLYIWNV
jgi:TusA-related sulfurtransferase